MIPQIMLNHRSYLVALVIGGMYNPFYARVLEEFTIQLHAIGHQVLLVHVDSGHSLDSVIPRLASYRVDAIVSALAVLSAEAAAALARFKIPVVSFNTPVKNEWVTSISSDNKGAGAEIADLFVARGARSFAYIAGPGRQSRQRRSAQGLSRPPRGSRLWRSVRLLPGTSITRAGCRGLLSLLRDSGPPDAIFCANDLIAIGAIDAIRSRTSLRAPEDVLLAGFDDIAMAGWAAYDLTTFVQDARLMVSETIRVLQTAEDARAPLRRGPSGSAGSTDRARFHPPGATPLRRAQQRLFSRAIARQPPRGEGVRPKRKFFPLSAPGPSCVVTLPDRLG